jgi:hypothetical protein
LFSSTITAIRDAGPATVAEDELPAVADLELGVGVTDDRVVLDPPPQPADKTTRRAVVTIHVTP